MKPWLKGAGLLLLAFALGGATGGLAYRAVQARGLIGKPADRPERFQEAMLGRLRRDLDLRPEQVRQVEAALAESGAEFKRLRVEFEPRLRDVRVRAEDRIRLVLDAEQQARFFALIEQWNRRIERRHDRGPNPGAPRDKMP